MMKTVLASAFFALIAAPALAQTPQGSTGSQTPTTPGVTTPDTPQSPSPSTPQAPHQGGKQGADNAMSDEMFAKADANRNGSLSLAEVQKGDATVTRADFDKYDADHSKTLSKAEFAKWAMAMSSAPASSPSR